MSGYTLLLVRKSVQIIVLCALVFPTVMLGSTQRAQAQNTTMFRCETPATVSESVQIAYEQHYQCTEKVFDAWFSKYPAEVAQLQNLYQAWQSSRRHDLRGQQAAGRWVQQYPVDFSARRVELSAAQAAEIGPTQSGDPVRIQGEFERFFVDRDNRRLFLTSQEEGLVSISMAARYAFKFEGKVGNSGARDFFIYDNNTALVEETNPKGGNRDLVVLDISNRSKPHEIARLRGVVPEINHAMMSGSSTFSSPPTFDQYRNIREGIMPSPCGSPPVDENQPYVRCRPDGSCYSLATVSEPAGICEAMVVDPTPSQITRMPFSDTWQDELSSRAGNEVFKAAAAPPMPTADKSLERRRVMPSPARRKASHDDAKASTAEGGAGGAGSLSQMMVYGKTLYVLSGSSGLQHGILTTFDLTDRKNPRVRQVLHLNNGPEALQRHDNLLLIAGRDAVVTASLGIESRPRLLGEFRQNCPVNRDPIVVQGAIGYRTIIVQGRRINCTSRLEVIDLSQPHQPMLRATYPIQNPRGLSVLGDRLFVTDEYQGVLVFDIGDRINPSVVGMWPMSGVKDLVLSDFDLYAMSGSEIKTFYVGPLYERGLNAAKAFEKIEGIQTVVSVSKALVQDRMR